MSSNLTAPTIFLAASWARGTRAIRAGHVTTVSESGSIGAWLELPEGKEFPLPRTCSIGRSHTNTLVLSDSKVSRRHALIQVHGEEQFMVVEMTDAGEHTLKGFEGSFAFHILPYVVAPIVNRR